MKFVKAIIYLLYLIVYAYSVHMTSVEPEKKLWGYLCGVIFAYLFISIVSIVVKQKKSDENKSENL
jgi:hypothetical protein